MQIAYGPGRNSSLAGKHWSIEELKGRRFDLYSRKILLAAVW